MQKVLQSKLGKIMDLVVLKTGLKIHKSRRDFITGIVFSLICTRSVQFPDLSKKLNDDVEDASNLRRIQSFIAEYDLSYLQIAVYLSCFLPKGKWRLSIDRTNWQVGETKHNILAITAHCRGVGVPLLFELLDNNGGNSNQSQRIKIFDKFIQIFGKDCIECIMGDREFIGKKWYKYLLKSNITFYIRIKNNHFVEKNGLRKYAEKWVYPKRKRCLLDVTITGCKVNIALKKTNKLDKKGEKENLLIITNADPKNAIAMYRSRWSIEVFFQSLKGRGFKLETTHLQDIVSLKKLFALVCIAFVTCLKAGIWRHENAKPIAIKNHGYKAKSFFRHGLDTIENSIRRIHQKKTLLDEIIQMLMEQIEDKIIEVNIRWIRLKWRKLKTHVI